MTRDEILSDLYERLTSRKFLAFVLTIGFAIWNFYAGRLDAVQFQTAIWLAATAYGVVEGASDFAAALRPSPKAPGDVQTVNVDTQAPPAVTATTRAPARRVRPSRAKVKTPSYAGSYGERGSAFVESLSANLERPSRAKAKTQLPGAK